MGAVDDILRRAKQLRRSDLSRLVRQLDAQLSSAANGGVSARKNLPERKRGRPRSLRSKRVKTRRKVSYAGLLSLAGTAHSDFTDVSTHKGKHLAEVYAPRREG